MSPGGRRRRLRGRAASPSLVLGLCAVAAGATSACDFEAARETVEIVAESGEIELRDTLRPAQGPPRVLILALDGVGHEALREALEAGRMPRLTAVTGSFVEGGVDRPAAHGWLAPPLLTVLPSITMAAWTTLFTGRPPAETGVPGNEWFDREAGAMRAPAPVSVGSTEQALATLSEGLLGDWIAAPTLYERAGVRAYVSMQAVHRGADLLTTASADELDDLLTAFLRGAASEEAVDREVYAVVDRASADGAAKAVRERGAPDLQVVYFGGVDLFTHVASRALADQQSYLAEVVDPAVGTVLDAWREAGALEGTWVLVVSDHGHTPVPSDETHALREDGPRSLRAVLAAEGWRVRPPELELPEDADHQAAVALQGGFAFVYLADRSACAAEGTPCAWERLPRDAAVDSVAAAILEAGDEGGALEGGIEMVLVPRRDSAGALVGVERWTAEGPATLDATSTDTALVRLEDRLGWLFDGPRGRLAGDVLVMARSGAWVPEERRRYFSHPYHSWHGSAHASDSRAPLLVARADLGGEAIAERVGGLLPERPTQMDFTDLVLALLRDEPAPGGR